MLYPEMTKSRMVFDLNGVWDFKLLPSGVQYAPETDCGCVGMIPMPVPSSFNDIYEGRAFADHAGDMLYKRKLAVTRQMLEDRLL